MKREKRGPPFSFSSLEDSFQFWALFSFRLFLSLHSWHCRPIWTEGYLKLESSYSDSSWRSSIRSMVPGHSSVSSSFIKLWLFRFHLTSYHLHKFKNKIKSFPRATVWFSSIHKKTLLISIQMGKSTFEFVSNSRKDFFLDANCVCPMKRKRILGFIHS